MAALAIGNCILSKKRSSSQEIYGRNDDDIMIRSPVSTICCQKFGESMDHLNPKIKKERKDIDDDDHHHYDEKRNLKQIFLGFGKGLKDSLSPKQKGDRKDLTLMCLSFAVYVYISQKIVCAYCVWMSMLNQPR
ncbi:hypothetical protein M9H77_02314 [Catharanthus roseus]|uniref:Uncharacterized protein n=1 Tax=Catharanthus roseus TaxID=4058 RepID=A0ACC0C8B6_CATRO|nr:hypothetical protein M9H77_02314 [Catharanthus roseus]